MSRLGPLLARTVGCREAQFWPGRTNCAWPGRATFVREVPVNIERTSVGLDVHARSVVAAAIDNETGEILRRRFFGLDTGVVLAWVKTLPAPVRAVYEAGPTGVERPSP